MNNDNFLKRNFYPKDRMFGSLEAAAAAQEQENARLRNPEPEPQIAGMPDIEGKLGAAISYGVQSLGGPDVAPAFDMLGAATSMRGLSSKTPRVLGRLAPVSGRVKAAGGLASTADDYGNRRVNEVEPGGRPQVSPQQATLLRGLMRRAQPQGGTPIKMHQPMQY